MKNDIQISQLNLFEMLHDAVGYSRPPAYGATAENWLKMGKELITYRDAVVSDAEFYDIVKEKFGIGNDPVRAILSVMHNNLTIEKLNNVAPKNKFSYSWIQAFSKAKPEVVEKICNQLKDGNHVSYKDIDRLNALFAGGDNSRQARIKNRIKKAGIEDSDKKVADALIVASQSIADAMAEFDSIASGKLDKSDMMTCDQAKSEMTKQIKSVKDRLLLSSGGRAKVQINANKQTIEITLKPLRKEHPMKMFVSVKWGDDK